MTAVILLSRVFNGQVTTGAGIEFDALTAALLGGVSFAGGEGTILGLVTGVMIIAVLNKLLMFILNIVARVEQRLRLKYRVTSP
jgi:ribose/xylose/arabinose/galactoside ABC-type transport system permease subunit